MKITEIALETLDLNYERLRIRRPREEKRLLASLGETGQQSPIVVVPGDSLGRYVVIDGGKRVRALRKLKADIVKAVIWEMTPAQALIIAYQMQKSSGGWNALEEGWVVYELHRKHGWTLDQIDTALDKGQGWASRRLGLVETLPERVLDEVHKGHIGAYAAMKYLLPLARANPQDCEKLAASIAKHLFTSRQVGLLYRYLQEGPRSAAAKIIEDPMLFLRALEESQRATGRLDLNPGESRVVKNLELIANVSSGLAWHLPKVFGSDAGGPAKDKLSQVWDFCQERLGRLQKTMAALLSADEPSKVHAG